MPTDPERTRQLLRRHLLEILAAAGGGAWEPVAVAEPTLDGRALLVIAAVPLSPGDSPPADSPPADAARPGPRPDSKTFPRGRPAEVARFIVDFLRGQPGAHHADIMAAAELGGYSRTAANDNLKVLVKLGFVRHPAKGGPYHPADDSGPG